MKKLTQILKAVLLIVVLLTVISINVKAQSPNAFSYQVVLRDANGNARANENINITINIIKGSADGNTVYQETHNVTTNNQGLATLAIGAGTTNDNSFSNIDWPNGPYFINNLNNTGAFGNEAVPTASNTIVIGNSDITSIGGFVPWSNLSDARFKKDIQENVHGLDFIMKLKPVTYIWDMKKIDEFKGVKEVEKEDLYGSGKEREQKKHTGFLAQQVEEAAKSCGFDFSGIVKPANEMTPYNLAYSDFVVPMVKAMQEQQRIIDEQKFAIDKQQKQIDELMQLVKNSSMK